MGGFTESRSLGLIVELFLKSSVVLTVGVLGSRLLRRRSASLRHFLLSLCLVSLAFLPAFSVLSPGWHARWLPDWTAVRSEPAPGTGAAVGGSVRPAPGFGREPETNRAALELQTSRAGALRAGAGPVLFRAVLASVLPALWLAGLVLILARLAAGLYGARRLTREGEALADPAWLRLLRRFTSAVRLNRRIEIKAHPRVIVPLTWGFRRPVVIMPGGAGAWTEDERSSALFHELSHVKRGDFLVMLVVRLSLALFWFNPLCWVALRMLKSEQEKACDELVLRAGIRPSTYANNLLFFKRSAQSTRSPLAVLPGVLGMFGRSEFHERLLVILGQKMAFKEVPMKTKVAVSVLAFLAVSFIGLARPQAASAAPETGRVAPGAAAVVTTVGGQETPAQDAQKAQEKRKKEEPKPAERKKEEGQVKKEVKIIKRVQEPREEPVEITIIEGKTRKTIKLDGSAIIIKKGEDGKTVLMGPEGQEIAVIGGEGTRLEIKGGRTVFLDDEKSLEPAKEPKGFTVIEDDQKKRWVLDGDKKVVIVTTKTRPHLETGEEIEEPEHITINHGGREGGEIYVTKRRVATEPHVAVRVDEEELEKRLAETQALLKKIDEQKLAESNLAAQQEALRQLEKSLQALQEELEKKDATLKAFEGGAEPKVYVTLPDEKTREVEVEEITPREHAHAKTITASDREAYTVVLTMKLKDNPKGTYEKAVAKLKQELPKGYTFEPKFDEESGTMVLKISGPGRDEKAREKVERLVEELGKEVGK